MIRKIWLPAMAFMIGACFEKKSSGPDCSDIAGVCVETSSRVIGSIVDSEGKAVEGAMVSLYFDKATAAKKVSANAAAAVPDSALDSLKTDKDGKFAFSGLPGGEYALKAKKDSLGVSQEFSLAKGEVKNLKALTIVNNGIIIGSVNRSIVQQAENAYATINEIGEITTINEAGDFTFNNVPVTINNTYTINIVDKDGKPILDKDGKTILSGLEDISMTVKPGGVVRVDTTGTTVVNNAILKTEVPLSAAVAKGLGSLPGGTLKATLVSDTSKLEVEVDVESGVTPQLPIQAIDGSKKWVVLLQGIDSTGAVIYEGKDTIDLAKEKLEDLSIPFARKVATLFIKESVADSVFAIIAKTRRLILSGPGLDTVSASGTRTTGSVFKSDSAVISKGLIVTMQYLDADGKVQYTGSDTVDVVGAGKDTAVVSLSRLAGSLTLKGKFVDEAGGELSGLKFDTAYAVVYGTYMDSLNVQLVPKETGEFSAAFSKVPAGDKRYLAFIAKAGKGERSFSFKDSLVIVPGKDTTWEKNVKSAAIIPVFSVKDYDILVGDTGTAELEWTPKAPDTAVATLTSLDLTVARTGSGKFWGLKAGTVKIVTAVAGLTQKDTFQVVVKEREFSVADMKIEVDDTTRAVLTWKTKAPSTVAVSYRSLTTTIASVGLTTGLVTALAAGEVNVVATVTGVTKPDTFAVTITEPFREFTIKPDTGALSAIQGGDVSTVVRIKRTKLPAAITLSVTGAPTGVTAVISPATLTTDSSKLTFNCNQNPFPGTYKVYILAKTAGFADRKDSVTLTVMRDNSIVWKQISSGFHYSCGINDSGFAYCWGENTYGQLGIGSTVDQARPVRVSRSLVWKGISAGNRQACGVTIDGEGYCWGWDFYGGLGDGGTATQMLPVPVSVSGGDRWSSITTGMHYSCGVTTDGRGFCWGNNDYGQLGNGTTVDASTRVQVIGSQTWKSLLAGKGSTTCGLTTEGEAYCWGNNVSGTVGDGNFGNGANPLPVKVSGSKVWLQLSSGSNWNGGPGHACGITSTNDMYCWGDNDYGSLGVGNATAASLPSLVLNDIKWKSLAAGYATTCGLTTTGKGFCWGRNNAGQLGNGTTATSQTSPASVAGGYNWKSIAPGSGHSCAISEFDQVYCWGGNALGAGSTTSSYVPWRISEPLNP